MWPSRLLVSGYCCVNPKASAEVLLEFVEARLDDIVFDPTSSPAGTIEMPKHDATELEAGTSVAVSRGVGDAPVGPAATDDRSLDKLFRPRSVHGSFDSRLGDATAIWIAAKGLKAFLNNLRVPPSRALGSLGPPKLHSQS